MAAGGGSPALASRNEELIRCGLEALSLPSSERFERFTKLCIERLAETVSDAEMVELGALMGRVEYAANVWMVQRKRLRSAIRRVDSTDLRLREYKRLSKEDFLPIARRSLAASKVLRTAEGGLSVKELEVLTDARLTSKEETKAVLHRIAVVTDAAVEPLFFMHRLVQGMLVVRETLRVPIELSSDPELERIVHSLVERGKDAFALTKIGSGVYWDAYRIEDSSYVLKTFRLTKEDLEDEFVGLSTGMLLGSNMARGYSSLRMGLMLEPGVPFLIEKLVPGETLEVLKEKGVEGINPEKFARAYAEFCCNYLELCQKGFFNMDAHEGNIMVAPAEDGGLKLVLIDFGNASFEPMSEEGDPSSIYEAYSHLCGIISTFLLELLNDPLLAEEDFVWLSSEEFVEKISEAFEEAAPETFDPLINIYRELYEAITARRAIDVSALRELL